MTQKQKFAISHVYPGKLNNFIKNLMNVTGIDDPNEVIRAIMEGEWKLIPLIKPVIKPIPKSVLVMIGTVTVDIAVDTFIAKDKFLVGIGCDKQVKISYLGNNFKEWFLGKKESSFEGSEIKYQRLKRNSLDSVIIESLYGEEKAVTTLVEVFSLMEKQPCGEKGVLLANGYANIFYCYDANGVLRSVRLRWREDGWNIGSGLFNNPSGWYGGFRIFSRNHTC